MSQIKNNVSWVVNSVIDEIISELYRKNKHIISTETIKNRVKRHVRIYSEVEDISYLVEVGLAQVVQQRLHTKGFRSVRVGYFVNLDTCHDVSYLVELSKSADLSAAEKAIVSNEIKRIRDTRCDGQLEFDELGNVTIPMTEEEFQEKIKEDAV